jgi:hypothetical protein
MKKSPSVSSKKSSVGSLREAFDAFATEKAPVSKKAQLLSELQGQLSAKEFLGLTIEAALKVLAVVAETQGMTELAAHGDHITLAELFAKPKAPRLSKDERDAQEAAVARMFREMQEGDGDAPSDEAIADALGIDVRRVRAIVKRLLKAQRGT